MKIEDVKFDKNRPYVERFVKYDNKFRKFYGFIVKCDNCGKDCFCHNSKKKHKRRFCDNHCKNSSNLIKGENNPKWKGGRLLNTKGYVKVICKDHPNANLDGYMLEHRLVMEKHIGRYLEPWEVIHHKNSNKQDNRIENLELCSNVHTGQSAGFQIKEIKELRKQNVFLLELIFYLFQHKDLPELKKSCQQACPQEFEKIVAKV